MWLDLTLSDLVKYVLKHRKGKAFVGYNELEVAAEFLRAINERTMVVIVDNKKHSILGIATAIFTSPSILNVNQVLTTDKSALPRIIEYLQQAYPNVSLTAMRRGREVVYNTPKLINKILAYYATEC